MLGLRRSLTSASRCFQVGLGSRGGLPRTTSRFSLFAAATKPELPDGISLQVLDETYDMSLIKKLLLQAFITNNEPIVQVMGELHYPSLSIGERIPLVEHRLGKLFSEQTLTVKVKQGLSVAAIKDNDPNQVVSILFAERYGSSDTLYTKAGFLSEEDSLCQTGLNLMRTIHKKALPVLEDFEPDDVVFFSHGATHPKYQSLGVIQQISDMYCLFAEEKEIKIGYFITTAERLSKFVSTRYGTQVIAEVFYEDYQDNGKKVFAKLAQKEVSAKASVKYF